MSELDLPDIQGNIHRPYGRYGFPYARSLLFHIRPKGVNEGNGGRWFLDQLRHYVTTAEPWESRRTAGVPGLKPKPPVTLNVALTYQGLVALDLPTATLRGMPDEFIEGMSRRNHILGDLGPSHPCNWDPVWRQANQPGGQRVHIWVSLHAQARPQDGRPVEALQVWTDWLLALCGNRNADGQVVLLEGHGRDGQGRWQDSSTIMLTDPATGALVPTPDEHFGFMDGLSDPVFAGQHEAAEEAELLVGNGKLVPGPDGGRRWVPLAAGEFVFGYPSEGQEEATASVPYGFMRNGTFMAVRKLHQNTGSFAAQMEAYARGFQQVAGLASLEEARETLQAKMVGRWRCGIPLSAAPSFDGMLAMLDGYPMLRRRHDGEVLHGAEWLQLKDELVRIGPTLRDIRYADDPEGLKCPLGSHIRRANPRDMMDPQPERDAAGNLLATTTLVNRRRILRRGLPYGERTGRDEDEHGVFIMALCTSLFRQFEFIQQQWMQYGLDMESGNDTCPITGNHDQTAKFVVAADPAGRAMPFVAAGMAQYVTTRGGEYFFVPSLSALRMIAMGEIDPT